MAAGKGLNGGGWLQKFNVQGDNSTCSKPPVDFKTKVLFWPGQSRTSVLKSMGGFKQVELSPCTIQLSIIIYGVSAYLAPRH